MTYEMTFTNSFEAATAFTAMGLRRIPGAIATFVGTTYSDEGARIPTIARKSGVNTFSVYEKV